MTPTPPTNADRSWLDSLFQAAHPVTLITGPIGAGKTSLCLRALAAAQAAHLEVRGVLSPGRYDAAGHKVGIDLLDPATGERRALATRIPPEQVVKRRWRFAEAAIAHGAALLAASGPCDLLFVDEIGPLELEENGGWANALDVLRARAYAHALVVIRPSLHQALVERLAPLPVHTLTLA